MARSACLFASTLALAVGCGPVVVWHGRGPARARRAVVLEEDDRQRLLVDGAPQGEWDAIAISHLRWDEAGLVYPARAGERWHLVVDGEAGPPYEAIGEIATAGTRVAYAALDPEGWHVVVDGVAGPAFTSLRAGTITFGRGGRSLAYVGRDRSSERVVVDGRMGPRFDRVRGLVSGAKGRAFAYVGDDEDGSSVVVGGQRGERFDDVLELALASEEPRWAALAVRGEALVLLRDGEAFPVDDGAADLQLSPDGSHVAWVSRRGGAQGVWRDGERVGTFASVLRVRIVPRTGALLVLVEEDGGVRVVHEGSRGPRFDTVTGPLVSAAGHWGYVGYRDAGCAVVVDGAPVFRGEWAGALELAERADRWAFVARRAGRRFVVTADGPVAVPRPFVDSLVLDPEGRRWGLAVAHVDSRRVSVIVNGREVAPLDLDEVAAGQTQPLSGRSASEVVRGIVAGEIARLAPR
ncbi:MAG: hypothetical protein H6719_16530 [Sandaracinaceae bacterium]|nr:hypothetical protein [Sandaracinaceae bacterium]